MLSNSPQPIQNNNQQPAINPVASPIPPVQPNQDIPISPSFAPANGI